MKTEAVAEFIEKYRGQIEGEQVTDDWKFVHNKYMKFFISNGKSLSNLYKLIKSLSRKFVRRTQNNFNKNPFDQHSFVVMNNIDSIHIVCHLFPRIVMYRRQNGNPTLKNFSYTDIPYSKWIYKFFMKKGISRKNKKFYFTRNDA